MCLLRCLDYLSVSFYEAWEWIEENRAETLNYTMFIWGGKDMQEELAFRHPLNDRRQDAVVMKYAQGILQHGV